MRLSFLLVFGLILTSCKKETTITRVFRNDTNHTVRVRATGSTFSDLDFTVDPGRLQNLYVETRQEAVSEQEDPSRNIIHWLVTNTSGDTSRKDIHNSAGWEIEVRKVKNLPKTYAHTYTFAVSEEDF